MTAIVIIKIQAKDPSLLKDYQAVAPAIIEKYNGKFLARGGDIATLEGPQENRRLVLIEFPDMNTAKQFYYSDEYTHAISLRKDIANAEIIAIEGINR